MNAVREMLADVGQSWRGAAGYQRLLWWVGVALVLAGLGCVVAWLAQGAPALAGSTSWRKPIEFGISLGVTGIFLAWVLRWLPRSERLGWAVAVAYSVPAVVEWALITLQKVRGVPSHFNNSTDIDSTIFSGMGVAIIAVMLSLAATAAWAWRAAPAPDDRVMAAAVRAGLGFLLLGQLLGVLLLAHGFAVVDDTVLASFDRAGTFGAAGDIKVPHAIAIHGLQVLPVLGWLLTFSRYPEHRRQRLVWVGAAGFGGLLVATMVQMFAGRAPLDIELVAGLLAVAGAVALGGAYVVAVIDVLGRSRAAPLEAGG